MHLRSTLLTCSPALSTHESGLVNVEVLKKICERSEQKIFHGLTNPKMLPPALTYIYTGNDYGFQSVLFLLVRLPI